MGKSPHQNLHTRTKWVWPWSGCTLHISTPPERTVLYIRDVVTVLFQNGFEKTIGYIAGTQATTIRLIGCKAMVWWSSSCRALIDRRIVYIYIDICLIIFHGIFGISKLPFSFVSSSRITIHTK